MRGTTLFFVALWGIAAVLSSNSDGFKYSIEEAGVKFDISLISSELEGQKVRLFTASNLGDPINHMSFVKNANISLIPFGRREQIKQFELENCVYLKTNQTKGYDVDTWLCQFNLTFEGEYSKFASFPFLAELLMSNKNGYREDVSILPSFIFGEKNYENFVETNTLWGLETLDFANETNTPEVKLRLSTQYSARHPIFEKLQLAAIIFSKGDKSIQYRLTGNPIFPYGESQTFFDLPVSFGEIDPSAEFREDYLEVTFILRAEGKQMLMKETGRFRCSNSSSAQSQRTEEEPIFIVRNETVTVTENEDFGEGEITQETEHRRRGNHCHKKHGHRGHHRQRRNSTESESETEYRRPGRHSHKKHGHRDHCRKGRHQRNHSEGGWKVEYESDQHDVVTSKVPKRRCVVFKIILVAAGLIALLAFGACCFYRRRGCSRCRGRRTDEQPQISYVNLTHLQPFAQPEGGVAQAPDGTAAPLLAPPLQQQYAPGPQVVFNIPQRESL